MMGAKLHLVGPDGHGNTLYVFHCPGCAYGHAIPVPRWTWNESLDEPTFSPSILVNKFAPGARCHSHVIEGRVQFLADCFHALAGHTVELPDWD